ncbi:hypothetical protein V6N13_067796 [Hibiscus sabdariffa]
MLLKHTLDTTISFFLRLNRLPHPHILKTLLRSNTNPQNAVSATLKVSETLVFLNPYASLTIVQALLVVGAFTGFDLYFASVSSREK